MATLDDDKQSNEAETEIANIFYISITSVLLPIQGYNTKLL